MGLPCSLVQLPTEFFRREVSFKLDTAQEENKGATVKPLKHWTVCWALGAPGERTGEKHNGEG